MLAVASRACWRSLSLKMSAFCKITTTEEMNHLCSTLRDDFPIAKSMWQVVRDTQAGVMEANLFTDEWPHYTTVISQEFSPRISEFADIRIHTRNKEKIMQILDGARLLEKGGKWHAIQFVTDMDDDLDTYLCEALSSHPDVNGQILASYKAPMFQIPKEINVIPVPPGYIFKDLLPEHIERIAGLWNFKDWFTESFPYNQKVRFLKELILHFNGIGAFTVDDPSIPVSWAFQKSGGTLGIGVTLKEHRKRNLNFSLVKELGVRMQGRGEVVLMEFLMESSLLKLNLMVRFGLSHVIVMHDKF